MYYGVSQQLLPESIFARAICRPFVPVADIMSADPSPEEIAVARDRVSEILHEVSAIGKMGYNLEYELEGCLECVGDEALVAYVEMRLAEALALRETVKDALNIVEDKDFVLAQVGRPRTGHRLAYA